MRSKQCRERVGARNRSRSTSRDIRSRGIKQIQVGGSAAQGQTPRGRCQQQPCGQAAVPAPGQAAPWHCAAQAPPRTAQKRQDPNPHAECAQAPSGVTCQAQCPQGSLLDGGPPGCTSARQLSSLLTYSTHRVGTRPDRKPDGQTESHAPHTRASWQNPTVSSPDPMPSVSTLQLAATSGSHPPSGHSPMHAYNPLHFALFVILS